MYILYAAMSAFIWDMLLILKLIWKIQVVIIHVQHYPILKIVYKYRTCVWKRSAHVACYEGCYTKNKFYLYPAVINPRLTKPFCSTSHPRGMVTTPCKLENDPIHLIGFMV